MRKLLILLVVFTAVVRVFAQELDYEVAYTWDLIYVWDHVSVDQVKSAIKSGALKINKRNTTDRGSTPLMEAVLFADRPAIVMILLENGADVNARNDDQATPLLFATGNRFANIATVNMLLDAWADVNAHDNRGRTPLIEAVRCNDELPIINTLLNHWANVNAQDNDGVTPIMMAVINDVNPEIFTTLIKAGANLNTRNKDGDTPLIIATTKGKNPEIVTTLLNAGADATIKDKFGKTAWDYIQWNESLKNTIAYSALKQLPHY